MTSTALLVASGKVTVTFPLNTDPSSGITLIGILTAVPGLAVTLPTTMLTGVLGMFYAYRDINVIRNSKLLAGDELAIDESLKVGKSHGEENGFTKKLKSIILNEK